MRDSGRPVVWDRLSLRLMPGYGSVSKVARRSSTCSLEKLVLFLRLALREEPLPEATDLASSEGMQRKYGGLTSDRIHSYSLTYHDYQSSKPKRRCN